MRYRIDEKINKPAYLQLYELLREDIIAGVYPYQSKLPSKRLLSEELQISVITVQHALMLLNDEGYVESRERSGCFVIYRSDDFIESRENHETRSNVPAAGDAADTASGDGKDAGAFSFDMLAKMMRRILSEYGEQILVRSPNQGIAELREELASYLLRSRGISVQHSQIIIGSGAEYLYSLIAQLFDENIPIAVEDPCYEKIPQVYEAMGHPVERLKLGKNGILTGELEKTSAGILHVTPFHSYPSQITADISKKNEYLRWGRRHGIIIEDNYDSEITVSRKMEDSLFALDGGERVIYLDTFSKTIAPSLRAGYMVLPAGLVGDFERKLGFYSCTVPVYEQYLLCELLRSGEFERHINRVRRRLRREAH